ncbi:MAG: PPC domain-containing protein [Kofleriaceae bacterium]
MFNRRTAIVGVFVATLGCGDNTPDKIAVCQLSATASAVQVQDRKIIGVAAPYAADLSFAGRDEEFRTSIAARRHAAWQVVERVLQPIPLADPALAAQFGGQPEIPAWHTWYGRDDFDRLFKKLYRDLGADGRAARAPIDAQAGFTWNANALDELGDEWPEQRYLDYLAAIDTQVEADGVGGISRVGYSPGAMGHLLESYPKQYSCRLDPAPDPFDDDPMREGLPVTNTEDLDLAGCEWKVLGPFQAGNADVVVKTAGQGDADVYVRRGAPPEIDTYDCRSNGGDSSESCTVAGDGPVYVVVFGAEPSKVQLDVSYLAADVRDPTCLDGEMPRDAVLVKADWRRELAGDLLPVFDTSGPRMKARLGGEATWNTDGAAAPDESEIYTVVLNNQARFRLPALHIMSKELDHWMWITMWWSPTPDSDFGADRPQAIAQMPGPWRNYKMCVTTQYAEADPDRRGGQTGTLGDAIEAVHGGVGAPTWCSNPYLELGGGNAATNCIGCHQHGGTELTAESILSDQPHFGTTRVRNNFFTDYMWAVKGGAGEDLSALIQAEVDYWDANDHE